MFKSSQFDKTLETATSHLKLEPDWSSIIVICDLIRQNDVSAKHAITQIKKKMISQNPHTAMYALMVLESVVKNCGSPVHEELFANKANCEAFAQLVQTTPHENVRNKMLELIQTWSHAFRSAYKYRGIKDTMNILKTEGFKFPEMKDVSEKLFASDVAPEWADGDCCHRCRTTFSLVNRKHHCRNCGQVFCGQCSGKTSILPKFGIEKEVRVCDGCFDQLQKPPSAIVKKEDDDLPAEYLSSSLAQQNQQPARKTDEELREEEELQLALALSQSEAESKKQHQSLAYRRTATTYPKASSPPPPLNLQDSQRSPTPEPETPSDPELARYLNRSYWEQRQAQETTSPSAPSPMPSSISLNVQKTSAEKDAEIDEFTQTMRTQVEIFVNRMKSNSSRGRSIANDTSVQTLFMNITSMHSRLLTYIKEMDDKRLWYEQLQDKLSQIKDSRAALDVLRQEHIEKMRRIAEEQERQRQMQMAYKLEIMRKKKQEYLQYQRQLALQRIQEQEREMQMRQEQQKAQYMMGGGANPYPNSAFMSPPGAQGSPMHHPQQPQQFAGQFPGNYANPQAVYGQVPMNAPGGFPLQQSPSQPQNQMINNQTGVVPNPQSAFMPINPAQNTMQVPPPGSIITSTNGMENQMTMMPPGSQLPPNPGQQQQLPPMMQIPPIMSTTVAPSASMMQNPNYQQPQMNQNIAPVQNYQQPAPQQQQMQQPAPQQQQMQQPVPQQQPVSLPPQPPQSVEPEKPKEVEVAELISFD